MFTQVLSRLVLLILLAIPLGVSAEENFSSIVVFGDSLSDRGNLSAIIPVLKQYPYSGGFTNGDADEEVVVAVEVLAEELALPLEAANYLQRLPELIPMGNGTNFAVVAARARSSAMPAPGEPPSVPLIGQVKTFLYNYFNHPEEYGFDLDDALFVVFIGGNDIRDSRDEPYYRLAARIVREAVDEVEDVLELLAMYGVEHILVANAPDIGDIPETGWIGGPRLSKRATWLTRMFNWELKKTVRRIEYEIGLDIAEFNTFRFLRTILRHADKLGFTYTEQPCFLTFMSPDPMLVPPTFNTDVCKPEDHDFDLFVYFDEIHPAARIHELVGQAMAEAVKDAYSYGDEDEDEDEYEYGD